MKGHSPRWHVRSKWRRHQALSRDSRIRRHIPETSLYSRQALLSALRRHRVVFVKPVFGSFGKGILRISRGRAGYTVQSGTRKTTVAGRQQVVQMVSRYTGGRSYMIQRGISLLSMGRRPIDFRLLLLRPRRRWQIMGTMGKLAARGKIVTNFSSGGRPLTWDRALKAGLGLRARPRRSLLRRMNRLGMHIARRFRRKYDGTRKMGIDFAIDRRQRIWLLEINTNPRYELFRYHAKRGLYRRISRIVHGIHRRQR
ncbi:YheC/YheD family protein [Paenibacillus sp. y28]|uniref:YheC/YheD family protein n=1 Tax=Paenibacillus sp. y28 TaxID=3129110 RepID=UPI003018E317